MARYYTIQFGKNQQQKKNKKKKKKQNLKKKKKQKNKKKKLKNKKNYKNKNKTLFFFFFFFFQAEDGIRDHAQSRGLGDVYKRQGINAEQMGINSVKNAIFKYNKRLNLFKKPIQVQSFTHQKKKREKINNKKKDNQSNVQKAQILIILFYNKYKE
eukprot:TRINITY_DN4410_c0_g1_i1.p4 TRINITY_DN4410_c0_g1~~TRINITY_DN4410_c0_g1_i1.p4  ORF type:complete len:156 (+),score=60.20 TRINITY_DN4410_c0_g1_i1:90-557(+)